jgi:ABC-2 type transport system ATP-binding protein
MQLEIDAVTYRYPGARDAALTEVSSVLRPGITGLVGINGAGKTTLLKLLARALAPLSGQVSLDKDALHGPAGRALASRIALMPQDFRVPGQARVTDVLLYCAWLKGVDSAESLERVEWALHSVNLNDRAHDRIGRLSGGMLRRVALAQALLSRPHLILLDEPTTGLDPEQRAKMRDLLMEQLSGTASIVLLSSHLMEDIEATADRVMMLHEGRLRFDGEIDAFCRVDGEDLAPEAAFLRRIIKAR